MKIVLFGATGNIGSRILREATSRGHDLTAVVRRQGSLSDASRLRVVQGDARSPDEVARISSGHDALVLSVSARKPGDAPFPSVVQTIIDGVRQAGAVRLFVVGGAGSLEVAPGVQLVDTPQFPEAYKPEGLEQREALELLRASDVNWTYLSPAMMIAPGERTGRYRTGGDQVIFDQEGKSFISTEDYALAVLEELERPRHERQRFTVAY